jgi:tetratricopeptide (TPR) repeat protein
MIYTKLPAIIKLTLSAGMLLAAITLASCEKGAETQSATPPVQPQATIQPTYVPLTPMPTQGSPSQAALLTDPHQPQELAKLGDSYFEAQQYQKAISVYEKAIAVNSQDVDSMNDLGLAYFYSGNPDRALAVLANATSTKPDYNRAWLSTGYILLSQGRYNEAVSPLQKATELDPQGTVGKEAENFLRKIEQWTSNPAIPNQPPVPTQ